MRSFGPLLTRMAMFAAFALSNLASPAVAGDSRVRITNMVPFDVAVCHPNATATGFAPHLPVRPSKNQFRFVLRLVHMHSADAARASDLVPETAFAQVDLVRNQRFAASQRQLIERTLSAREFDGLLTNYQKTRKATLVPSLDAKCKALVEADGRWLDAARMLLEQETRMEKVAMELAAKAPSWQAAADALVAARQVTAEEVGKAESTRESDRKACPKLSYK